MIDCTKNIDSARLDIFKKSFSGNSMVSWRSSGFDAVGSEYAHRSRRMERQRSREEARATSHDQHAHDTSSVPRSSEERPRSSRSPHARSRTPKDRSAKVPAPKQVENKESRVGRSPPQQRIKDEPMKEASPSPKRSSRSNVPDDTKMENQDSTAPTGDWATQNPLQTLPMLGWTHSPRKSLPNRRRFISSSKHPTISCHHEKKIRLKRRVTNRRNSLPWQRSPADRL